MKYVYGIAALLALLLCLPGKGQAQQVDFRQSYTRGKLLLRQKLYYDAIREFKKANDTVVGRTHFGVYYYLAMSYFWLPDIQMSMRNLKIAQRLAKSGNHRYLVNTLSRKISNLYGTFKVEPEVDPYEVGTLKVKLSPKLAFSHPHKKRYFKIISHRLRKAGLVPNGGVVYLPKGEYTISIYQPQCLKYGLVESGAIAQEINIDGGLVSLKLQAKRSCRCHGGQKIFKRGKGFFCACPSGMGWNKKKKRCEVGRNLVPWIVGGIGVVVAGTTAIVIGIVASQNDGTTRRLICLKGGNCTTQKAPVWK